jgi:hypothetical protein
MLTSKPTHGGGAPFGVDLDAGVAKITVRRPAPAAGADDENEQPVETADESPQDLEQPTP